MAEPFYQDNQATVYLGNALTILASLPRESVHTCVTSPPYFGQRVYVGEQKLAWGGDPLCSHDWLPGIRPGKSGGRHDLQDENRGSRFLPTEHATCSRCGAWDGSLGNEPDPWLYTQHLAQVFHEVKRVLRPDGAMFLNLGDALAGSNCGSHDYRPKGASLSANPERYQGQKPGLPRGYKAKDLMGVPWMVAFALRDDGWWLRADIIWRNISAMPESVQDRPTLDFEHIFLLTKKPNYYFDLDSCREPVALVSLQRVQRGLTVNPQGPYFKQLGELETMGERFASPEGRHLRSVWEFPSGAQPTWRVAGQDVNIFAAFPLELPRRAILLSCPPYTCSQCGRGWRRIIERQPSTMNIRVRDAKRGVATPMEGYRASEEEVANYREEVMGTRKTIGWKPGCSCGEEKKDQGIVLDPFAGSGTTLLAARLLGRGAIGIDIAEPYVELMAKRLQETQPAMMPITEERVD